MPRSGSSSGETKVGRIPFSTSPSITEEWTFRCTTTWSPMWPSAIEVAWLPCEAPLIRNQVRRAPQASAASSWACWKGVGSGPMSTPSVTEGMSLISPVIPTSSTIEGSAPIPPLCPGTWKRPVSRAEYSSIASTKGVVSCFGVSHAGESKGAEGSPERDFREMEHNRLGYWIRGGGRCHTAPASGRRSRRRRPDRRRRLHRHVDRLARPPAGPRCADRPARVRTGLRPRAERSQRRLLRGDVDLAGLDAGTLGRRARRSPSPTPPRRRRCGSAAFCAEEGVDAWYRQGGYLQVSTTRFNDDVDADALAACRELGVAEKLREVPAAEVQERCASPAFRAGVIEPVTATVQPARLALGLRRRLIEEGVDIYECSPVRRFVEAPGGVEATSRDRRPRPRPARRPRDRRRRQRPRRAAARTPHRRLLAHRHHRAGPRRGREDRLDRRRGDHRRPVPRPLLPHHARTAGSPSAGAAAGSRWAPAPAAAPRSTPASSRQQRRHLVDYFPDLAGRRITHAWGGPIDASPTHLPAVTSLPRSRAWVAAGYTGNGVGPTNMVGLTLASLALDRTDDPTRLAFVDAQEPPRPARALPLDRRRSDPPRRS